MTEIRPPDSARGTSGPEAASPLEHDDQPLGLGKANFQTKPFICPPTGFSHDPHVNLSPSPSLGVQSL